MSVSELFVNRNSELKRMRSGLSTKSGAQMYTVSGPSGFGKSALLQEFATRCESEGAAVIWYEMGEPDTTQIFFQRFLETWEEEFPNSVVSHLKEKIEPSTIKSISGAASLVDPSGGVASTALGTILAKLFRTGDGVEKTIDPLSLVSDVIDNKAKECDSVVIIIDQYSPESLHGNQSQKFDSIFREISRTLPKNVTCYIGTSRHIVNEPEGILQVSVDELNYTATEELIRKRGFSPEEDTIGEIYNRTRGHPFVLDKLLKVAEEDGLRNALNDAPLDKPSLIEYLESSLLNQLSVEEEQLLRDSCVLRELRPHIVSEMAGTSPANARQILTDLHHRGIVKRGGTVDETIFTCHDLQRDYILDQQSLRQKRRNHLKAARAFLIHAGEFWSGDQRANSDEEERTLNKYLEYMANFDHQIQHASDHYEINRCIVNILSDMEEVDKKQSIDAIQNYYLSDLGESGTTEPNTILNAIENPEIDSA